MAGSEAEERIRGKVEEALRLQHPTARIIHELVLDQGGVRIDVAAVEPDALIVAEIKSERDVLKRLPEQVRVARQVAQSVWVVVADKHVPAIEHRLTQTLWRERYGPAHRWHWSYSSTDRVPSAGQIGDQNQDYIQGLSECRILMERPDEDLALVRPYYRDSGRRLSPWSMLDMLWAPELRTLLAAHRIAVSANTARHKAMMEATELMTGREIRRAVCAALRRRSFPRADPAVLVDAVMRAETSLANIEMVRSA